MTVITFFWGMIHHQAYCLVNLFPRNFENPGNKPAVRSVFLSDDYWLDVYSLIAKTSSKLKSMIISYSGFSCSVNASLKRVHLFAMAITAFLILIRVIIFFFFIDHIFRVVWIV